MPGTKRQPATGVIARLLAQPQRFAFTQSINLLLAALRRQGVSYEHAFRDRIRFRNSLSLAFPASEVQALAIEHSEHSDAIDTIHLTPAFIGLLGACGTLPLHDSERLTEQQQLERDASQHELIDVFSNRMIGMFYETWGKYRVEHGLQVRGQDRLLPMLLALAGAAPARRPDAAAFYAGILRTRPVSAGSIERVLREHFQLPVRVEQMVGCWDDIAPRRRSTLGARGPGAAPGPVLGRSAVLGARLWRHDTRARLHIGPLDENRLFHFLPGGAGRLALAEMLALFAVPMIAWEVRLLLAAPCVDRLTLSAGAAARKLGWNSFLTATPGIAQRTHIASMLKLPKRN